MGGTEASAARWVTRSLKNGVWRCRTVTAVGSVSGAESSHCTASSPTARSTHPSAAKLGPPVRLAMPLAKVPLPAPRT